MVWEKEKKNLMQSDFATLKVFGMTRLGFEPTTSQSWFNLSHTYCNWFCMFVCHTGGDGGESGAPYYQYQGGYHQHSAPAEIYQYQ